MHRPHVVCSLTFPSWRGGLEVEQTAGLTHPASWLCRVEQTSLVLPEAQGVPAMATPTYLLKLGFPRQGPVPASSLLEAPFVHLNLSPPMGDTRMFVAKGAQHGR